jgi:hypothetical protein
MFARHVLPLCALALAACGPSGKPTRLSQLRNLRLSVQAAPTLGDPWSRPAPALGEFRRPDQVHLRVEVQFDGAGDTDPEGDSCPALDGDARATVAGQPVVWIDRGGPAAEGLLRTEYYRCLPFRFESAPGTPSFDAAAEVVLTDGSKQLRATVEGLFLARAATFAAAATPIRRGDDLHVALPPGSGTSKASATLWQLRPDMRWGGFGLPVSSAGSDSFRVRLQHQEDPDLVQPGPHGLEVYLEGLTARFTECAGWTCSATPLTVAGPFEFELQ